MTFLLSWLCLPLPSSIIAESATPNPTKIKKIVLFKSLWNCKRRKKENFTLKYISNKIILCEGGGQYCLV